MLSKFKRNKHQQHLAQLPKISQSVDDVDFFYGPPTSRETLLEKIASAKQRICIVALYLEQDDGGKGILNALYEAKRQRPELDVRCWSTGIVHNVDALALRHLTLTLTGTAAWRRKIRA
ncbi:phosphatidylserine synthase [Escherichia coli]|nr:phosphatidylserine synthase [Escherichia coli]